jgi:hypothetical protein
MVLMKKKFFFWSKTVLFVFLYPTKDLQAPREDSSPSDSYSILTFFSFFGDSLGLPGSGSERLFANVKDVLWSGSREIITVRGQSYVLHLPKY